MPTRLEPKYALDQKTVNSARTSIGIYAAFMTLYGAILLSAGQDLGLTTTFPVLAYLPFVEVILAIVVNFKTNHHNISVGMRLVVWVAVAAMLPDFFTLNLFGILLRGSFILFLALQYSGLKGLNKRIDHPAKESEEAYHSLLISMLVEVMRADGHVDLRERKKLAEICDALPMSDYEREHLIQEALKAPPLNLRSTCYTFLRAADAANIEQPTHHLLVAAAAIAGADGIFDPGEASIIEQFGKHLKVAPATLSALLTETEQNIEGMDLDVAFSTLGLQRSANPSEIFAAHEQLTNDLGQLKPQHFGSGVEHYVLQRIKALDRARDVLSGT